MQWHWKLRNTITKKPIKIVYFGVFARLKMMRVVELDSGWKLENIENNNSKGVRREKEVKERRCILSNILSVPITPFSCVWHSNFFHFLLIFGQVTWFVGYLSHSCPSSVRVHKVSDTAPSQFLEYLCIIEQCLLNSSSCIWTNQFNVQQLSASSVIAKFLSV